MKIRAITASCGMHLCTSKSVIISKYKTNRKCIHISYWCTLYPSIAWNMRVLFVSFPRILSLADSILLKSYVYVQQCIGKRGAQRVSFTPISFNYLGCKSCTCCYVNFFIFLKRASARKIRQTSALLHKAGKLNNTYRVIHRISCQFDEILNYAFNRVGRF